MAYAQAKQALHDRHGNLDIDIAMYLDPKDYGYELHYIDVPVFDGAVYKGKVDKLGQPVNQEEYNLWVSNLPKVKQHNPFHTHRLHFDPSKVTEDKIKAAMDFHLPNFYEAWKAGKSIRSGWDTNTRTHPTRYEKFLTPEAFQVRQSLVLQKVSEFAVVSKSVTLTGGRTFPATTIDVGAAAENRSGNFSLNDTTALDIINPANDTGILDTFEIYLNVAGSITAGVFSGSGTSYSGNDYFSWGDVSAGSKQTSTGQSVDVETGNFIGLHSGTPTCSMEAVFSTSTKTVYTKAYNQFGTGTQTYALQVYNSMSLYATGDTGGGGTKIPIFMNYYRQMRG